jgi:hypothetical protein
MDGTNSQKSVYSTCTRALTFENLGPGLMDAKGTRSCFLTVKFSTN